MDLEEIKPVEGCSEELKVALQGFRDNVTESYTTGSRRWSIWSLLGDHFDQPLELLLNTNGAENFFQGERFSAFCKRTSFDEADLYLSSIFKKYNTRLRAADIDILRSVISFCDDRRPMKISSYYFSKTRSPYYRKGGRPPFCELCWKRSQAHQELHDGEKFSLKTERFCADHDPRNPDSMYRTDHNNRKAFYDNLRTITRTGYYYNITDFEQRQHSRWVAYRMTKLHIRDKDIAVMDLLMDGFSQSEIARKLGASRQNISKIKMKTEGFIEYWREIRTSSYPIDPEDLAVWENFDQADPD